MKLIIKREATFKNNSDIEVKVTQKKARSVCVEPKSHPLVAEVKLSKVHHKILDPPWYHKKFQNF